MDVPNYCAERSIPGMESSASRSSLAFVVSMVTNRFAHAPSQLVVPAKADDESGWSLLCDARLGVVAALLCLAWIGYETQGRMHARSLRDRLLDADTNEVPAIVNEMASYRRWVDPLLFDARAKSNQGNRSRKQLHLSLALLPSDRNELEYLTNRLLEAQPQEIAVIGSP